jgi:hypothetical protein
MIDFDEIVFMPDVGMVTLQTAVQRIIRQPPKPGEVRVTSLYRGEGLAPSIYGFEDVARLAAML